MIIAITNHKGGTGKTTTAANLASGLSHLGKTVLVIDLDPQASLSYSLGILEPEHDSINWMLGNSDFDSTAVACGSVHLIPCSTAYYDLEEQFAARSKQYRHKLLFNALLSVSSRYDFVILDCPPSFSILTENALHASGFVLIPTLFEVLPILGIEQMLNFIERIRLSHPGNIQVLGVLGVNVDERRQLTYEVLEYIRDHYAIHVFNNYIRANVKAAEAPSFAKTVIDYAPGSNSARDYLAFTNEFIRVIENVHAGIPELTI